MKSTYVVEKYIVRWILLPHQWIKFQLPNTNIFPALACVKVKINDTHVYTRSFLNVQLGWEVICTLERAMGDFSYIRVYMQWKPKKINK